MALDEVSLLCPRCLDMRVPEGELIAYLARYASELPDAQRADAQTYASRLAACAACSQRAGATCRLCGCYVQARAAKKRMRCPLPGAPKWVEARENPNAED